MRSSQRQGELFGRANSFVGSNQPTKKLYLSKDFIEAWQEKIYSHQSKLINGLEFKARQTSLFKENTSYSIDQFKPWKLKALPMNFWRHANPPHNGQAMYIVMDQLDNDKKFIILYIGETIAADKRWKGIHDCKVYLDNYCEALQKANISNQLSIRFWNDVPKETIARRKIEQELIQQWCPPFNKETRTIWQTPFTTEIN